MINAIYVTGAYGRKYKTLESAKADWEAGKDFRIIDGPYCSKRDFGILDTVYFQLLGKLN